MAEHTIIETKINSSKYETWVISKDGIANHWVNTGLRE